MVGFFYFSGIEELYEGIKNNPNLKIKVLVGLNVDKYNNQLIEISQNNKSLSNNEIKYSFFNSIKKSINNDDFDNKNFYEQIKFFLNLIKEDRLIIRKTINPNHSKLYLFELTDNQAKKEIFITGSSNLTKLGITTQEEFNVEISDYGFKDANDYFDDLWKNSIEITEKNEIKEQLIHLLEKETFIKEITPFGAYFLILKMYIDSFKSKKIGEDLLKNIFEKNNYRLYKYQLDAINQAVQIIREHNGVILADVVGLGKTIIACSIAKLLRKRGIIICPPGIVGDTKKKDSGWNMYKEQFKLYDWEVWSLGDLEKLLNYVNKSNDIEVIIIDEAHRFRNEDTKNYELLKNICRGKKVILLTATPFNNKPKDVLSLLKLFQIPKKSTIILDDNLMDRFAAFEGVFRRLSFIKKYYSSSDIKKRSKALNYYKALFEEEFNGKESLGKINQRSQYLSKQIRNVIESVLIRRNRLDLKENPEYKEELEELSKVADPIEWFYELTEEESNFYDKVIRDYFGNPEDGGLFKGAIYQPYKYEVEKLPDDNNLDAKENFEYNQQLNLYDFMRRLLVKRFESSFGAFKKSIENFKKVTEISLKFIKKTNKFILDRDLLEIIYNKDTDEIEDRLIDYVNKINDGQYPKNHKIYYLEKFKKKDSFLADIKSDLDLFNLILKKLDKLNFSKNDPKTNSLIDNLKKCLEKEPSRKIIIFSEYLDTVKYLKDELEKAFPEKILTVEDNLSKNKLELIYKNFDASYEVKENQYQILLTSDKISEGFNLNRAGMVVNYDIPWNPVRVIQRFGRINRISKKVFDELYIVNFFPTEKGSNIIKSREIASNKMYLIHNTIGEDSKIFDIDEEPTPSKLYKKIMENPDNLEGESFITKAIKKYYQLKRDYPNIINSLENYPLRLKVAKKSNKNELIVFFKKGKIYSFFADYKIEEVDEISIEEGLKKIECNIDEKRKDLSMNFWDFYEKVKKFKKSKKLSNVSELSLENRAKSFLKTLIRMDNERLIEYKNFLTKLLEDIEDYGTLPDYTLRRIVNLNNSDDLNKLDIDKLIEDINLLKKDLGEDFLEKEIKISNKFNKELIVAIENQK